jgi:ubiquinone/menaquinone biosynthesis C-methylase UbiE
MNRAVVDEIGVQPGATLLDIGAGVGPATVEAAKRVVPDGVVIAVEPSRFMRSMLRARRQWQRTRRAIDIRSGSAEALPVADSSIDAAWAVNAVHHFDDVQRAMEELARVLKPGGRALLVEEDFEHHPRTGDKLEHGLVDEATLTDQLQAATLGVDRSEHRIIGGAAALVIAVTKLQAESS